MSNPSSIEDLPQSSVDVMFQAILAFLLPFFLPPAFGNTNAAGMTILHLVEAYNAATPRELDLAGQIVILGRAAMDSIHRSNDPDLPDSKVLSYRAGAVSLTRSAARLQKELAALQKSRSPGCRTLRAFCPARATDDEPESPAPAETPAPMKAPVVTETPAPQAAKPPPATPAPIAARPHAGNPGLTDELLGKMQLDAHAAIKVLQTQNASLTSVAFPVIPDPATAAKAAAQAAAQAAMASAHYKAAGPPK